MAENNYSEKFWWVDPKTGQFYLISIMEAMVYNAISGNRHNKLIRVKSPEVARILYGRKNEV